MGVGFLGESRQADPHGAQEDQREQCGEASGALFHLSTTLSIYLFFMPVANVHTLRRAKNRAQE
jgi:hypothetical protein